MVAGGDYGAVKAADAEEMAEYGANVNDSQTFVSKNKMKGKDVSHLQKSVLDKLAYLDEDDDEDGFEDLDDMFSPTKSGDDYEKELEAQLAAAFKADKKGGAAKLLKEAVGVDYVEEKDMDMDDLEAQLEDTLYMGNMDIDDIGAQQQAMDEYNKDAIQLDFNNMEVDELRDHVEETWAGIEEMK